MFDLPEQIWLCESPGKAVGADLSETGAISQSSMDQMTKKKEGQ
jgi:hypothetical protein